MLNLKEKSDQEIVELLDDLAGKRACKHIFHNATKQMKAITDELEKTNRTHIIDIVRQYN